MAKRSPSAAKATKLAGSRIVAVIWYTRSSTIVFRLLGERWRCRRSPGLNLFGGLTGRGQSSPEYRPEHPCCGDASPSPKPFAEGGGAESSEPVACSRHLIL